MPSIKASFTRNSLNSAVSKICDKGQAMPNLRGAALRSRTEIATKFLAAAELARRGYIVSFDESGAADLVAKVRDNDLQFRVKVAGLSYDNAWLIRKKPDLDHLFYMLIRLGGTAREDRFFILEQPQLNELLNKSSTEHPNDPTSGFAFRYPRDFEDNWDALPPP